MKRFIKITVGFVHQRFNKNEDGQLVCTDQAFIAGDETSYEDEQGKSLMTIPQYVYEPLEMKSPTGPSLTFQFYNEAFGTLEPDRNITASSREAALEQALFEMGYSLVQQTENNQNQEYCDEQE